MILRGLQLALRNICALHNSTCTSDCFHVWEGEGRRSRRACASRRLQSFDKSRSVLTLCWQFCRNMNPGRSLNHYGAEIRSDQNFYSSRGRSGRSRSGSRRARLIRSK